MPSWDHGATWKQSHIPHGIQKQAKQLHAAGNRSYTMNSTGVEISTKPGNGLKNMAGWGLPKAGQEMLGEMTSTHSLFTWVLTRKSEERSWGSRSLCVQMGIWTETNTESGWGQGNVPWTACSDKVLWYPESTAGLVKKSSAATDRSQQPWLSVVAPGGYMCLIIDFWFIKQYTQSCNSKRQKDFHSPGQ